MVDYINYETWKTNLLNSLKAGYPKALLPGVLDFFVYGKWTNLPELFNSHNSWFSDTSSSSPWFF
jgi:hypothetical protein